MTGMQDQVYMKDSMWFGKIFRVLFWGSCMVGVCCHAAYGQEAAERRDTLAGARITSRYDRNVSSTQTGLTRIDSRRFNSGYAFMSSPDVIKTLQMLPGVASGTELLSGLYVHGGTGSDNLFLLDGVPLYKVSHIAGLFSSFNTDVVESVDFYRSGFPSRYGGRLSSVVDVRTRDGDFEDYHGLFSIGLIDGRFQYDGPIVRGRTSFNVAVRTSWMDAVLLPAFAIANAAAKPTAYKPYPDKTSAGYTFYDLNFRITHRFSMDNILRFNLYNGMDALRYKQIVMDQAYISGHGGSQEKHYGPDMSRIRLNWGNLAVSADWTAEPTDGLHSDIVLYHSMNYGKTGFTVREWSWNDGDVYGTYDDSNTSWIHDTGLKADFIYDAVPRNRFRFGMSYQYHYYAPRSEYSVQMTGNGVEDTPETDLTSMHYHSHEAGLYAGDEINVARWMDAEVGFRYALFGTSGKTWHGFEPRVSVKFLCGPSVSFRLSYVEMNQFNHSIAAAYVDLPTNTWMPSTDRIRPMHSRQFAGGVYAELPMNIHLSVEGFYRTLDHIYEYNGINGLFPPLDTWEDSFVEGHGLAWGGEVEAGYSGERLEVTAAYTLSWNFRKFEEFYYDWYPDRNDNRHRVNIMTTYRFSPKIDVYCAWNYHSGSRMTFPTQSLGDTGHDNYFPQEFYTAPNNIKLPDYHRLDLGINFRGKTRRGYEKIWNISIYNAYCRMNAVFATVEKDSDGRLYGKAGAMFPVIPSFSYTVKF